MTTKGCSRKSTNLGDTLPEGAGPGVRDRRLGVEVPLGSCQRLQQPRVADGGSCGGSCMGSAAGTTGPPRRRG
jgi:hypothetical protein